MTILRLDKLTVRFGGLTAVDGVDCAVGEKQIFSIIGPNGAGKTTVFNAITGIYEPTSGTIEFRGSQLRRPLTWKIVVASILVGLSVGLVSALLSVDVNALWRATIKRNYEGPGKPFSVADAGADAVGYMRNELALERVRGGRWAVTTADGRRTLGYGANLEEAEALRQRFDQLISRASQPAVLTERDGKWIVRDADDSVDLLSMDSETDARAALERFADIDREGASRRQHAWIALLVGTLIGAAGTWAVWNRARTTPEVISRAGIARTFQNIRLFQNMTVLDNVLVAMDRRLSGGVLRMAFRLPGVSRQEQEATARACELLRFVSLEGQQHMLAKNLPYGDQRRLEIARALATDPQLILLDEPAAGMNPAESLELNVLIERIRASGLSVLLIEHHMKVVMGISDRIVVLDYGAKIAEGTPEEVRANPKVIAAYLGSEEVT